MTDLKPSMVPRSKSISLTRICFSALLVMLGLSGRAPASEVSVQAGLAYNSNPNGLPDSLSGQWTIRSYLSSGVRLFRSSRALMRLHYQGGIEQRIPEGITSYPPEGAITNALTLSLDYRPLRRAWLGFEAKGKSRNVRHIPGRPGYLNQDATLSIDHQPISQFTSRMYHNRSAKEYHERGTGFRSHATGLVIQRPIWPTLRASLTLAQSHLRFDRTALRCDASGKVVADSTGTAQRDVLSEAKARLQLTGRLLLLFEYAFHHNESNSHGYAFRGHKLVLVATKQLGANVVGQAYASLHWRHYQDSLMTAPDTYLEEDEYEQRMYIVRISRALKERLEIQAQYAYRRASSQQEKLYHQHLFYVSMGLSH